MRKFGRIAFFALLLVLMVLGASCRAFKKCGKNNGGGNEGGGDNPGGDQTQVDPNKEVEIEYWHANGSALTVVLEQIKASFEAKYPQYKVTLVSYGDYTTLRDTITGAIAAGVTPTAAQTYPDHVALYLQGKSLVALPAANCA